MKAEKFLVNKLNLLHQNFPAMTIKYGIDNDINAHLIELIPIELYKDTDISKHWVSIYKEFRAEYPEIDIAFFSSDSLLSIDNVIHEWSISYNSEKDLLSWLFLQNIPEPMFIPSRCSFTSNSGMVTNSRLSREIKTGKYENSDNDYSLAA